MRRMLLLILCLLAVSGFVTGQEPVAPERVLACVDGRAYGVLLMNGSHTLTSEQVADLYTLEGYGDVWVGYDNGGWNVPVDIRPLGRLYLWNDDTDRAMIWIYIADSMPGWTYWFVFDNMKPFADRNGNHYGIHPCGVYRVWSG